MGNATVINAVQGQVSTVTPGAPAVAVDEPAPVHGVIVPTQIEPDAPIAAARQEIQAQQQPHPPEAPKVYHPSLAKTAPAKSRKSKYIVLTSLWLLGVPLAMIANAIVISSQAEQLPELIKFALVLVSYVSGLYGVLGWIPLALCYMRDQRKGGNV